MRRLKGGLEQDRFRGHKTGMGHKRDSSQQRATHAGMAIGEAVLSVVIIGTIGLAEVGGGGEDCDILRSTGDEIRSQQEHGSPSCQHRARPSIPQGGEESQQQAQQGNEDEGAHRRRWFQFWNSRG